VLVVNQHAALLCNVIGSMLASLLHSAIAGQGRLAQSLPPDALSSPPLQS
jgi:hypothetical protein